MARVVGRQKVEAEGDRHPLLELCGIVLERLGVELDLREGVGGGDGIDGFDGGGLEDLDEMGEGRAGLGLGDDADVLDVQVGPLLVRRQRLVEVPGLEVGRGGVVFVELPEPLPTSVERVVGGDRAAERGALEVEMGVGGSAAERVVEVMVLEGTGAQEGACGSPDGAGLHVLGLAGEWAGRRAVLVPLGHVFGGRFGHRIAEQPGWELLRS